MHTKPIHLRLLILTLSAVVLSFSNPKATNALEAPVDRLQFVIPFAAGGGSEVVALRIMRYAAKYTDVPIDLLYMPGGGGVIGARQVLATDPDQPIMFMVSTATFITAPPPDAGYTAEDFEWIAHVQVYGVGFVAPPDTEYSFEEIMDRAINEPDSMSLGVFLGGPAEIVASRLRESVGASFREVPFENTGEIMLAILGGHIDAGIVALAAGIEGHRSGNARLLSISHSERLDNLPDVPTIAEVTDTDVIVGLNRAMFAQPGVSPEFVQFVEDLVEKIVADPGFREETMQDGELPMFMKGAELEQYLNSQFVTFRPLFEQARE